MGDKIYILKTTRGYGGDDDKVVNTLTDAFAEIMVDQIEIKAKQMLIEAIHPKYRSRDVDVKFAKAFDAFLESADYKFNTETVEDVIKERDEANKVKLRLQDYWGGFLRMYNSLQISGDGRSLRAAQEMIREISLILGHEEWQQNN